jgi:acetoin utilization deacetylase AcuC-like enzyme
LLPGGGHDAYLYAMQRIVIPAAERFKPDLIVVSSGLDANCVDPLARMLAHSGTFRELTLQTMALADQFCGGRLIAVHEGGYAEAVVPFCCHAIMEALTGHDSDFEDPTLEMSLASQPNERVVALQRQIIDEFVVALCD